MCGRYLYFDQKNARIQSLMEQLKMEMEPEAFAALSLGEVFPTQPTPVCLLSETAEKLAPTPMRWGMQHPSGKGLIINARSENAPRSRMFADSLRNRRCVICSSGYYEWEKSSRKKYYFTMPNEQMLCLAGFYQLQTDGPHFVIMTQNALADLADIHHRMPVVLDEAQALGYLSGADHLYCAGKLLYRHV